MESWHVKSKTKIEIEGYRLSHVFKFINYSFLSTRISGCLAKRLCCYANGREALGYLNLPAILLAERWQVWAWTRWVALGLPECNGTLFCINSFFFSFFLPFKKNY